MPPDSTHLYSHSHQQLAFKRNDTFHNWVFSRRIPQDNLRHHWNPPKPPSSWSCCRAAPFATQHKPSKTPKSLKMISSLQGAGPRLRGQVGAPRSSCKEKQPGCSSKEKKQQLHHPCCHGSFEIFFFLPFWTSLTKNKFSAALHSGNNQYLKGCGRLWQRGLILVPDNSRGNLI